MKWFFIATFFVTFLSLQGNSTQFYSGIPTDSKLESNASLAKRLKIRVYLEGALVNFGGQFAEDGRKLMRDDLRVSPFTGLNYIPSTDPYSTIINEVNLSINNTHIGIGGAMEMTTIINPQAVFGVTGENAIVDWIFVEIRSAANNKQVIATRSGLLQRDGDIVDLDGVSDLLFPDLLDQTFYVVVRHRNHLGAMSMIVDGNSLIDFSDPNMELYNYGATINPYFDYTNLSVKTFLYNTPCLWAGDFNSDLNICYNPPNDDTNILFNEYRIYGQNENDNNVIGYFQGDFDMNSKLKFVNPNDDTNLLYAQTLFFPLNQNYLSNFKMFMEQVPLKN